MQYTILNFLSPTLIPELGTDVAAGSASHGHQILIPVSAIRALPDQFAVTVLYNLNLTIVTAGSAIIALGIQLCVHDVVVDELHHFQHGRNVVLHVRIPLPAC